MMKRYDILVIGGGPAGATAARFLAQKHYKVLLVQKSFTFQKPCGGGVVLKAFDEFGLDKSMIKHPVDNVRFVAPSLLGITVKLEHEPLAIVDRLEFDTYLRTLAQNEGAEVLEGSFKSYDGSVARIKSHGSELLIEGKYIIAADGVNSTVRKMVTGTLPKRVLTLYATVEKRLRNQCEFWFGKNIADGYYAWSFLHDRGVHIGLACKNSAKADRSFRDFCTKLGLENPPKVRGYYIPLWKDDVYRKDNIVFIGDAAGQVSPFTYEGIYYAMRSAMYAVEAIDSGDLDNYQILWQSNLQRRFKTMHLLQVGLLHWDWVIERVVRVLDNPNVHQAALRFWSGKSTPKSAWKTVKTVLTLLYQKNNLNR